MILPSFLAFSLGAAGAAEPASTDLHGRVTDLLSGIENPATEADWIALGSGAATELIAVANDANALPTHRGNALVALGYFPSSTTEALLTQWVVGEGSDSLLRRKACLGLARGFGDNAVSSLTVALSSADVQLRAAAGRALGEIGSEAAKAAISTRLSTESNASVRDTLSRALASKE
jgi:hypothetical protein